MADRIHLAEPAPPHCSSCFQAKPQMEHVDFGAAWDGPVVPGEGVVQHVIDDLIICRRCLEEAGLLIGLGDVGKLKDELQEAETANDNLMNTIRGLKKYIASLEDVRENRPSEILDPPKRQRRKAAA